MFHTIHSDFLQVSIKQVGMELCSIKNKQTGTEYVWQGNPRYWTGQAPILFPIIGSLKHKKTVINGQQYAIPKHGILRNSTKTKLIHGDTDTVIFQFHWDDETLLLYPFKFVFEVAFQLKGKELEVSHTIRNQGNEEMPYNLGGHPAFNCPAKEGEEYNDYYIEFQYPENEVTWLLGSTGLISDQSKPMLENSSAIRLHGSLFDRDALIFRTLKSNYATLKSDVSGDILRVDFHEFPYLGIWAKPNAPFVCIEPWHGIADHESTSGNFLSKEKLRFLEAGSEETLSYSITILE